MTTTLTSDTVSAAVPRETAIEFRGSPPGLEPYTRFTLLGIDGEPLFWLQCDDEPAIALPVAEAFAVDPAYEFELRTADACLLALEDPRTALILSVLTVPRGGGVITANLLAPIVINQVTGLARQVILDESRYSLRHPVDVLMR